MCHLATICHWLPITEARQNATVDPLLGYGGTDGLILAGLARRIPLKVSASVKKPANFDTLTGKNEERMINTQLLAEQL
jgi:hypothetical protein